MFFLPLVLQVLFMIYLFCLYYHWSRLCFCKPDTQYVDASEILRPGCVHLALAGCLIVGPDLSAPTTP
jgi:hypothetical protein